MIRLRKILPIALVAAAVVVMATLAEAQRGAGGGGGGGGGGKGGRFGSRATPGASNPTPRPPEAVPAVTDTAAAEAVAAPSLPAVVPPAPSFAAGGRSAGASAVAPGLDKYRVLYERNIFLRNRGRSAPERFGPPRLAPAYNPDERLVLNGIVQQGGDYVAFIEDTQSRKTSTVQAGGTIGRGRLASMTLDAVQYTRDGSTAKIAIGSTLAGTVAAVPRPMPVPVLGTPVSGPGPGFGGSRFGASMPAPGAGAPAAGPAGGTLSVSTTGSAPAGAPAMVVVPVPSEDGAFEDDDTEPPTRPSTAPLSVTGQPGAPKGDPLSIEEQMRLRREQELEK